MKRWLFLDFDDTLYPYTPCNDAATAVVIDRLQARFGDDAAATYDLAKHIVKSHIGGTGASHSRLQYVARAIEHYGKPDPKFALELDALFWDTFMQRMTLSEHVPAFLAQGKILGYGFGMVTNLTTDVQYRKLVRLGLENHFDMIVTSEDAGIEKPGSAIFQLALERAACKPHQVTYIDDDKPSVDATSKMGMRSIHLASHADWAHLAGRVYGPGNL